MAVTDARNWPGTLEIGEFSARWRGAVGDSVTHSHFAAQAVFAAPSASVEHAGTVVETPALLIEPNVPHRLGPCALADLYFVEPTRHAVLPELVAAISAGPYRLVSQPSGIAFWEGWLAKEEPAPRDRRLIDAMWLLDSQLETGPVRLAALAGAAGLSPDRFRHLFVEQRNERAQDTRLGLSTKTQQDEVVPREDGVHHLRHDRVLVPDDTGEQRSSVGEPLDQVPAEFVLD